MISPKVSVIMPVYNGEKFLRNAIESILNQTFSDLELIIINDGSSDASVEIIKSYADLRIVFINNDRNMGLPYVRNQGLDASRGEYIAWLDCDDISVPDRLEKQVRLLDQNPQLGVCGAWMKIIGGDNDIIAKYPADTEYIRANLLFWSCLANSTVMMRAACTREIGLRFNLSHHFAQDYGLWVRIPLNWKIINLPEVLTVYRLHPNQVTSIYKQKQIDITWEIQKEQLLKLRVIPSKEERVIHMSLSGLVQDTFKYPVNLLEAKNYIMKLDEANKKHKIYAERAFQDVLLERWLSTSSSNLSSTRLILISYWMRFKLDSRKLDLPRRTIKKIRRIIMERLK